MSFRAKKSKKAGIKGEGQGQTIQNRVRDVFRKGLQWKWDREAGPPVRVPQNVDSADSHETTEPTTQKHWPLLAPVAIQRIKRLFSVEGASNASFDKSMDISPEKVSDGMRPCSSPVSRVENMKAGEMVRVKAQDAKSGEESIPSAPTLVCASIDDVPSLPSTSIESTTDYIPIKNAVINEHQICNPQSISTPPTMLGSFEMDEKKDLRLLPSHTSDVNEEIKASDEHKSADYDCSRDNKSIVCDVDKIESLVLASQPSSDILSTVTVKHKDSMLEKKESLSSPGNGSIALFPPKILEKNINEECVASQLSSSKEVIAHKKSSTNPSIVLSTIDTKQNSNDQLEKLSPALYLNIDSSNSCGNHARKSPVTVQEWVDSIPISPHLDEDLEQTSSEADLPENNSELQVHGDGCPSVTIRPASSQSGAAAGQRREAFSRDASPSLQSDTGSHGSSVDSFLEARRADPEEVLLGLGFGGPLHNAEAEVSRIPARFLQPSKVKGVAIDDFLRYQQDLIETFESGYSGYRGLTGGGGEGGVGAISGDTEMLNPNALSLIPERFRLTSSASSPAHKHFSQMQNFFPESFANIPSRFLPQSNPVSSGGRRPSHLLTVPPPEKFNRRRSSIPGGAQIPSVIVAKIMEKLREHERDSSTKSSAGSSPGHHADISKRRFSRAAHRVTILTKMKSRDSITSGAQAHSVLNPDNRKFLDNQGSKSPEVSRKRMIIGHRSFTFDGDGQLIETDTNSEEGVVPEAIVPLKPLPPRPLVHKDSVLSSATSLSLTSYDSDSDTDEASAGERNKDETSGRTNHLSLNRLLSTPVSSNIVKSESAIITSDVHSDNTNSRSDNRRRSLPSACDLLLNALASSQAQDLMDSNIHVKENIKAMQTSTPDKSVTWKDFHQVCSAPTISPVCPPHPFGLKTHLEEDSSIACDVNGSCGKAPQKLKKNISSLPKVFQEASGTQVPTLEPSSSIGPSPHYYQITDFALPFDNSSPLNSPGCQSSCSVDNQFIQTESRFSMPKSSCMFLDKELRRKLSLSSSIDSNVASVAHSPDCKHWSTSSVSSWESEKDHPIQTVCNENLSTDPCTFLLKQEPPVSMSPVPDQSSMNLRRRGSLKRQQKVDEEDSVAASSSVSLEVGMLSVPGDQGDSFEMEELAVDEELRGVRVGSAHSDSSGFQDEPNLKKEIPMKTTLRKQLSESEPMLYTELFPEEAVLIHSAEHLKRFSLPVIRIQDESGYTQWRPSSMGGKSILLPSSLRRVQSLPTQLSRLGLRRLSDSISPGSVADSIGNMFSSCSDESVIHVLKPNIDVTLDPEQDILPLCAAIIDNEGEVEALRTPRECRRCGSFLKKSLLECRSDLTVCKVKNESLLRIHEGLEMLRKAQDQIEKAMHQVQSQLCPSLDANVITTLQQVSAVVQQQSELYVQLENLNSDLVASSNKLAVACTCKCPSLSHTSALKDSQEFGSFNSPHSAETCELVCQFVETENKKLHDLVEMNLKELSSVRELLEKLLST